MTPLTSPYLINILEQPAALEATLHWLSQAPGLTSFSDELAAGKYSRIVLTGMGSSYYALHPLYLRLLGQSFCTHMIETSELLHHASNLINPQNLIVAVSQSGESAEILQLVEQTQNGVCLIGITNTADSLLAQESNTALVTQAGAEHSVSCKTYLSALAALSWLGDNLLGVQEQGHFVQLASLPDVLAGYLEHWQERVAVLSDRLQRVQNLFLLGRGSSLAAVGAGALIIKEAARFHAEGMSSAAFRHGPIEVLSPQVFVLVYLGSSQTASQNAQLVQDLRSAGGNVEAVRQGRSASPFELPSFDPALLPLLEILPAQMLSLALAELQDIQPGQFHLASKVTTVE
jgi:glucosamine--fructose-6-phosphate aminotransferase (isomerizing)